MLSAELTYSLFYCSGSLALTSVAAISLRTHWVVDEKMFNLSLWQRGCSEKVLVDLLQTLKRLSVAGLAAVAMFTICFVLVTYLQMLRKRATLPPGPFPWPIVGNYHQLPKSKPWLAFQTWSRANGNPLLTVWMGRTPMIICNYAWSASELMDKRSNIYSSRPRNIVFGEMTGQDTTNQTLLPYGDEWRQQRRTMVRAEYSPSLQISTYSSNANISVAYGTRYSSNSPL